MVTFVVTTFVVHSMMVVSAFMAMMSSAISVRRCIGH